MSKVVSGESAYTEPVGIPNDVAMAIERNKANARLVALSFPFVILNDSLLC